MLLLILFMRTGTFSLPILHSSVVFLIGSGNVLTSILVFHEPRAHGTRLQLVSLYNSI